MLYHQRYVRCGQWVRMDVAGWASLLYIDLGEGTHMKVGCSTMLYNLIRRSIRITMASKSRDNDDLAKYVQQANSTLLASLQRLSLNEPLPSSNPPPRPSFEQTGPSIFDIIEQFTVEDTVEVKIAGFELTQFTQRRKDELFKRHKKEQEDQLVQRKREAQKGYNLRESTTKLLKGEFTLHSEHLAKSETYPITAEDMDKLRPETDLNDVIVGTYVKLLQFSFLPVAISQQMHLYSSFFLEKLIGDYVREEIICDRNPAQLLISVKERVKENYKNVKRWTRKFDLFEKEILVFPVNAFRHWFCIFVLRPGALLGSHPGKCQLIYCDSMFEQRDFVVQAFRKYLECELEDKKNLTLELNESNLPCHQLLLPRQTNTHDCGLYMLAYIEELLFKKEELLQLELVPRRRKLHLFPRTLIFTMRDRLRKLFIGLINSKDEQEKHDILGNYRAEKERIVQSADRSDYDQINEREYKKYEKMNLAAAIASTQEERAYLCELRFYLDPEINYYEKDK